MAEEIAMAGSFLQFASIWGLDNFRAQIAFPIRRKHNEELVLGGTFAEYDLYKRNTARLFREYTDDVDDFCSNL